MPPADVLAFILDSMPLASTVIWLTGNSEFAYTVSMLRLRKHKVILIGPSASKTPQFSGAGTCWLSWDYEVLHQRAPTDAASPSIRGSPSQSPKSKPISADATPMGMSPAGAPLLTKSVSPPPPSRVSPPRTNGSLGNTLNSPFYSTNGLFHNNSSNSNGFSTSFNMSSSSSLPTPFSSSSPLRPSAGFFFTLPEPTTISTTPRNVSPAIYSDDC